MRHGQSVADTEGRCEGNTDFALTDLGMQQATSAATWIAAHFPPQMLFRAFLNLPMDSEVGMKTDNTGIHLWRIAGRGRPTGFLNRCDHLLPGKV
jgi:bisphosphoglycerate-dependent phosphoglycerate mutase